MKQRLFIHGLIVLMSWQVTQAAPPPNDNFASRLRATGENVTVTGSSAEATTEPGEPALFHGLGATLWWSYTAPKDGKLRITGHAPGDELFPNPRVDARLFTGNTLETLQDFDPFGFSFNRAVEFETRAGMEYQILTDTIVSAPFIGYRGPVSLHFEYLPTPANDDFTNRITLAGEAFHVRGTTESATVQAGEKATSSGGNEHTVWYEWRAPASGPVYLHVTQEEGNAHAVAVFTNEPVDNVEFLLPVGMNGCCSFPARAGELYYLRVGTGAAATSQFQLALSLNGRPVIVGPTLTWSGITFSVYGQPDAVYQVESSTNLLDWLPLSTGGWVDQSEPTRFRFYRAVRSQ